MKLSTLLLIALPVMLSGPDAGRAAEYAPAETEAIRVAASIYPVTMLVEEIGGDRVSATTIISPGVDPHHFEPTPSSARAALQSEAVFMIGGDFDSYVVGGWPPDYQVRIEFNKVLSDSLIGLGRTFNPHFWLDPLIAKAMGEMIGLALISADPAGRSHYEGRLERFRARIDSLHAEVAGRLAAAGVDRFVSFHPAWTYFARRYGLKEVGVVEMYPEHEPSARWVADLIVEMKRNEVGILIVEKASDPGVVRGIEGDTGAAVVMLDPIGEPGDPERGDYFALTRYNVSLLEKSGKGVE